MITAKLTDDEAVKDIAFPVEFKAFDAGAQVAPASASLSFYDPDGNAVISAQAMTIDGAGTATYLIAADDLDTLWENARIEILYVVNGVSYYHKDFVDVVLSKLTPVVNDDDLRAFYPDIRDEIFDEQANYTPQIDAAFRLIKRDIKNKGRRPCMLFDSDQIREMTIYRAFEIIFRAFAKQPDDIWYIRANEAKSMYEALLGAMLIVYDADEDGIITEDEKKIQLDRMIFVR
jgi:hypothetical protein